jgi:hypothetical protein
MLKFFLPLLLLLVVIPTLVWGFPGVWALTALVPSFIVAATLQHSRQRADGPVAPTLPGAPTTPRLVRPGVVVLGGLFGLGSGAASVTLMWAAVAPSHIVIASTIEIVAPLDRVWDHVGDPLRRTRWSPWMVDVEPMGRGGKPIPGSEFRAMLALERLEVPATLRVIAVTPPTEFQWSIDPQGGSTLEHMVETVRLEQRSDRVVVHYELAYDVASVFGRVAERIAVRRAVERTADEAMTRLRTAVVAVE